jgi:predicted TIM-barrel fold metal-dependent hydrolase
VSQVTYGTDYPYFPTTQIDQLRELGLKPDELKAIGSGNAMKLVPRLQA